MSDYKLTKDLFCVAVEISRGSQQRTGTKPNPLKLCKFGVNLTTLPAVPQAGEQEVSRANVKTVEIHDAKGINDWSGPKPARA